MISNEVLEYAREKNLRATRLYPRLSASPQLLETVVDASRGDATDAVETICTYLWEKGVSAPDTNDPWWDEQRQAAFLTEVRDAYVFGAMLHCADKDQPQTMKGLADVAAYLTEQAATLTLSHVKTAFEQKVAAGARERSQLTRESGVVEAARAVERVEQGEFLMQYRSIDVALDTLRECGEQFDLTTQLRGAERRYLREATSEMSAIAEIPEMSGSSYKRATAALDALIGTRQYVVDLCARSLEDIGRGDYASAASRLSTSARSETGRESVQGSFEEGLKRDFPGAYRRLRQSRIPVSSEKVGIH